MKKWSNSDLLDWIKSIGLSDKWQSQMVTAITDAECTGQDFASLENAKELGESFGITSPMLYKRVFKAIKKVKDKQEQDAIELAMSNNNNNNNNSYGSGGGSSSTKTSLGYGKEIEQKDGEFELNLFAQSKYWSIRQKVTKHTTVRRVKELYKDTAAIDTPVDDIVLMSKGKTLASDKTLGFYGIQNEMHRISVKFKVVGGMAYQPEYDSDDEENRKRKIDFYKHRSLIKKSKAADCIMGYDDDDIDVEGGRADIGCPGHHAMVAGTMYKWIKTSLEKNMKAVTVACPVQSCGRFVLDWDKITAIAAMNGKEYAKWTGVIEDRLKPPTKNCPYCKAEAQRKQGVIIFRMRCTACRNPDWCWNCEQKWKGGGLIWCSNQNCGLIKDTNKFLREAPLITPGYLKNVKIPNTRACPSCLTFIEHKKACKHMTCVGCTTKFCFVCLGLYDKNGSGWPCSDHKFECNPAPVQEFK